MIWCVNGNQKTNLCWYVAMYVTIVTNMLHTYSVTRWHIKLYQLDMHRYTIHTSPNQTSHMFRKLLRAHMDTTSIQYYSICSYRLRLMHIAIAHQYIHISCHSAVYLMAIISIPGDATLVIIPRSDHVF